MKKSFMTRILATGLSFAMAFSMAAATNVTTASAAVKKASVTSFMKASSKTVVEGKTVTTYMKSNVAKKYRIKKHTESTVAKKYISVENISSRKGLKITAKEGALAAANLEKKGVNVKIYFAPGKSAAAAKKATATKYVNLKVVVKAKPVEALAMTAAATGVKKITVTFNKAVDTDATTVTIKKASATPTVASTVWADDKKSVVITLATKMTEGTYTVTSGDLTASVPVKNETLTSFALVSTNLVALPNNTTGASISYKALNQYEEMMGVANAPQISGTFGTYAAEGTVVDGIKCKRPTADAAGVAVFTGITSTLCIPGQTGTIVIVDTTTGVNLNSPVTYQSKAVASSATVAGIYSDKTESLIDGNMTVGDKVANYSVLVNIKDQFESDMTVATASASGISLNPASVLTDVTTEGSYLNADVSNCKDITYNGANYILIPLKSNDTASGTEHGSCNTNNINHDGTLSLTLVSSFKGVLATPSFTIDPMSTIATFTVTQDGVIKAGAKNKLAFEAYDAAGNAITSYSKLKNLVKITKAHSADQCYFSKKTDGTADLIYVPDDVAATDTTKLTNTAVRTLTFGVNANTSASYKVTTLVATVSEAGQVVKVTGAGKDTQLAASSTKAALTFDLNTLNYGDQYDDTQTVNTGADVSKVSAKLVDKDGIFQNVTGGGVTFAKVGNAYTVAKGALTKTASALVMSTSGIKGTATLYLSYYNATVNKNAADVDNYDVKITLSAKDVSGIVYEDVQIAKINGGNIIPATASSINFVASADLSGSDAKKTFAAAGAGSIPVVVTAKVNGSTVVVPTEYVTLITTSVDGLKDPSDTNPAQDKEITVKAVVQTDSTAYTVEKTATLSNKAPAIASISTKTSANVVTNSGVSTLAAGTSYALTSFDVLNNVIEVKDQYGQTYDDNDSKVVPGLLFDVTFTGSNADDVTVKFSGAKNDAVTVAFKNVSTNYTATITVSNGDKTLTASKDVTFKIAP